MKQIGFVCFGEVNTPYEKLVIKRDGALKTLMEGVTGKYMMQALLLMIRSIRLLMLLLKS